MINGLFKEISEEEMMCVNGGCGSNGNYHNLPGNFNSTGTTKYDGSKAKAISNACSYFAVCVFMPLTAVSAGGVAAASVGKIASAGGAACTLVGASQGDKD